MTDGDLKARLKQHYALKEVALEKRKSSAAVAVHVIIVIFMYLNVNLL